MEIIVKDPTTTTPNIKDSGSDDFYGGILPNFSRINDSNAILTVLKQKKKAFKKHFMS